MQLTENHRRYWRPAAGFQQAPCPGDIGLEGRDRVAVGDADDGLGGEMDDRIYLVLAQSALQKLLVGDVAPDDLHFVQMARADHLAVGYPVPDEADDIRACRHQRFHQPPADKARRAGYEGRAVPPKLFISLYHQTFQGAWPDCHRFSKIFFSRKVSMHCQKPS